MADNSLTRLPLGGQLGVSVLVAALICGAFWYFSYSPMLEEESKKQAQLEALQREIRALEVTANKLQEFQREVQLLEAQLETLKRILPADKETPDLMRRVQALASQSRLNIKNFTPGPEVAKDFYKEVPINVDVEGTYHDLGLFFDRVSRLARLVNMANVKVKAHQKQTASNTIAASGVATTYVYVDKPAQPPPGAPGARPGARPGAPAR
jgi:type IV pilus assembly protein PilO